MKFSVEAAVFEKLPQVCFGVVAARGIDNSRSYPEIESMLDAAAAAAAQRYQGRKVKEDERETVLEVLF